jgi:hypothetical protein
MVSSRREDHESDRAAPDSELYFPRQHVDDLESTSEAALAREADSRDYYAALTPIGSTSMRMVGLISTCTRDLLSVIDLAVGDTSVGSTPSKARDRHLGL